jgi:hypothetical protein
MHSTERRRFRPHNAPAASFVRILFHRLCGQKSLLLTNQQVDQDVIGFDHRTETSAALAALEPPHA